MKKNSIIVIIITGIVLATFGCTEKTYTPKPRGYFNIETPDPAYSLYDTTCNFTFEFSKYSMVIPSAGEARNPCWINIFYPRFDATIHITYDPIQNNLKSYLDDSYDLVYKHAVKSTGILEQQIMDTNARVYGVKYKIEGDAACPYQFYLTDSTRHFFRAALYYNFKPNYDSLFQVTEFIERDMDHMVETFNWK